MSRGNRKTHQRKNSAEDNMIRMIDDGRREYNPSSLRVRKVKVGELNKGRVPDFAPVPKDDARMFDEKEYKETRRIKEIFLRHKKEWPED